MNPTTGHSVHIRNVGLLFYKQNEAAIKSVRKQLFLNLQRYHPSIAFAVRKLLDDRVKKASSPLIGELYPHILNGLVSGIAPDTLKEISAQWLAAYMLTNMIDNSFDTGEPIDGTLIAPLHLEATKLHKKVIGTHFVDMFEQLTFEAIRGQIMDMQLQKMVGYGKEKLQSARNKNKILSAFSVVIASLLQNSSQHSFAISFSENFLLGFQMLDDISDFESDLKEGNITFLLNNISIHKEKLDKRREILGQLIFSGNLQKTLIQVMTSMSKGLEMIEGTSGSAGDFFRHLAYEVSVLNDLVLGYKKATNKTTVLDKVDEQIRIVCQSS